ncbi:MAG TPA: sugar phosphorylase [Anaerolineales bacterium]|nr:sugar phosphorylase [Anaerolineales bacterium]
MTAGFSLIRECLAEIYGPERIASVMAHLENLVRERSGETTTPRAASLSERDAILITYPDQIGAGGEAPLVSLDRFAGQYLKGLISGIHLLPFYPSSSDDGFSVTDYRAVDPAYGDWGNIESLGRQFDLMFDAVLNHASVHSRWFEDYLRNEEPYRGYFITVSGQPNLSAVVRPRTTPLLTSFASESGDRWVWTTFSADQADLDYRNPAVLLEMLDILLSYVDRGARFIRLDAVAYIWKEIGTSCIHLPQVHLIVRLLRGILEMVAPGVVLITETNVAHAENVRYLGNGSDEAHLVYNFTLPPLLLHTFHSQDSRVLSDWIANMRMPGNQPGFFNVLATHDGIGLNGAQGILTEVEIRQLIHRVQSSGGFVSWRSGSEGAPVPYELNANYLDALDAGGAPDNANAAARFICAHAILLSLRGVPGVYFHSLFGSRGWPEGAAATGHARKVNREKLGAVTLARALKDRASLRARVYTGIKRLLLARRESAAFSPWAQQRVLEAGPGILALLRVGSANGEAVLCLHNVTPEVQHFACRLWQVGEAGGQIRDLVGMGTMVWEPESMLRLEPFQCIWLTKAQDNAS